MKLTGVIWLSFPERLTCQSGTNQTVWRAAEAVSEANRTNVASVWNNVFIYCNVGWLKRCTRQFNNMASSRQENKWRGGLFLVKSHVIYGMVKVVLFFGI